MHLIFRDHTISRPDWLCLLLGCRRRDAAMSHLYAHHQAGRATGSGYGARRHYAGDSRWRKCLGDIILSRDVNFCGDSTTPLAHDPGVEAVTVSKRLPGMKRFWQALALLDSRLLDRREFQCAGSAALPKTIAPAGLPLPGARVLCRKRFPGQRATAHAGFRGAPDCGRQRLELVVRTPSTIPPTLPRVRRALPQALSFRNVYPTGFGAQLPDYLAQSILHGVSAARTYRAADGISTRGLYFGDVVRYFEMDVGAAVYTSDRPAFTTRCTAKTFPLDSVYAGIDAENLYGRLDFAGPMPDGEMALVVNVEYWKPDALTVQRAAYRPDIEVQSGRIRKWTGSSPSDPSPSDPSPSDPSPTDPGLTASQDSPAGISVAMGRQFEFRIPLAWLAGTLVSSKAGADCVPPAGRLRLRLSLWQNQLPVDALPVEGWIELQLLSADELAASV